MLRKAAAQSDRVMNIALNAWYGVCPGALGKTLKIPTHLTIRERRKLSQLATGRRCIVEIGSYVGASAAAILSAERPQGSRLFCIDTWANDAMTEGHRSTEDEFKRNLADRLDEIVMMKGLSCDQQSLLATATQHVDMLFIDGDHSYESVNADWEMYCGFLVEGSAIAFHDYAWAEGVRSVVSRKVTKVCRSSGSLPNMWWGIVA